MGKKTFYLLTKKENIFKDSAKFKLVTEPSVNQTYSQKNLQNYPDVYVKKNELIEFPLYSNPSTIVQFHKLYDETLQNEKYFNNITFPTSEDGFAYYSGYVYMRDYGESLWTLFNNLTFYNGGTNIHRLVECDVVVNGNTNYHETYFTLSDVCTFNKIYVDLDSLTCKRRISHKDDANPSHTYNGVYYAAAYNCYDENFNLLYFDNDAPVLAATAIGIIDTSSLLNTRLRLFREGSTNGSWNGNSNLDKVDSKDILKINTNTITYIQLNDDNLPVKYLSDTPYKIIEENGIKYAHPGRVASSFDNGQFFVKQSEIDTSDGITRKCRLIANNIKRSLIVNPLPYEYQEVEWIEGNSTNFYLNTGVKMDLNKETYIEGKFLIPSGGSRRYIFGSYAGTNYVNIEIIEANLLRLCMGTDKGLSSSEISFNTPEISTFSYNPSTNTATTTYGQNVVSAVYDYKGVHTNNVSLFTDTRKSDSPFAGIRVYYYKHYENGSLKCHLIPCYRKSDNVIGMYDLISKSFKINELTGTFTKGNNVS